jgi:dUTP pyrophosphatase
VLLDLLSFLFRKTIKIVCSVLPEYKTQGAAGFDLSIIEDFSLAPNDLHNFHTGIRMDIPKDYCILVFPRSSLGQKKIIIPNSVGVIDSDYRGEIKVPLLNLSDETIEFKSGMRVAQGVLIPARQSHLVKVTSLAETSRGMGGFGSTGI